jgi:mannosyltransferase
MRPDAKRKRFLNLTPDLAHSRALDLSPLHNGEGEGELPIGSSEGGEVKSSAKAKYIQQKGFILITALILLLAAGLRFYRLDAQSFWNDEGNSARIAERPLWQIVEGAGGDIHPPGYYILLAGWRSLAGHSELALRALSALAGVLTAALCYAIGSRLFDRRVGLLAALLVAIHPFQVYYAQEARMYALLGTFSAASILLTAAVLTIPGQMTAGRFKPRQAALTIGSYILVNAAGLYTHYSFPLVLAAESLVFLIWLLGRPKKLHGLLTWILIQGAALLLFLPWLPTAVRQIITWPSSSGTPVGALMLGSAVAYGVTLPPETARLGLIPLLIVAVLGVFPPVDPAVDRHYLRFEERIGLVAAWLLLPLVTLVVMGAATEPFLKFLIPSSLGLSILAARGAVMVFDISRPIPGTSPVNTISIRGIGLVLLVAGLFPSIIGLQHLYFDPAYARDDYRAIAARIMEEVGPDAAVILNAPNQWEVFTYYYPDGPGIAPLPDNTTEQTLARLLADYGRIYALYWGTEQQDPDRIVEQTLEANAFTVSSDWYQGVRLVTYAVIGQPADEIETASGASFGESITLEGLSLSTDQLAPGEALGVTLFWRTDAPLQQRYKVFVHLYGPDGTLMAQHDSEPASDKAPTDGWMPGETVIDNHGLLLPLDAPAGDYQLVVGLYDFEGNRLIVNGEGDSLTLGHLPVGW